MSTRAIIALPTEKGYITAWRWCDGDPATTGVELRKYFKDEKLVRELIYCHSFDGIWGPSVLKDEGIMMSVSSGIKFLRKLSNGRYITQTPHMGNVVAGTGKYGFFRDVEEMLAQDINYLYIFNPKTCEWKTLK